MRLNKIQLIKFKRFDDLTIDLGEHPKKIVALVGPNGCGKSSVFDAFEQVVQDYVGLHHQSVGAAFFSKSFYDNLNPVSDYSKSRSIKLIGSNGDKKYRYGENISGSSAFNEKHLYVRSAYRYTSALKVDALRKKGPILKDSIRPGNSISLDPRLSENYERLLGRMFEEFERGNRTGAAVRSEYIDRLNRRLKSVLEIQISSLGNVTEGRGQLYFEKGTSKDFPFQNLSSGEKEVLDILIDLEVKISSYDDTVYCIDEPELHLNTSIQRRLLKEIVEQIPDTCQLWVATHSVGFLRALQKDLSNDVQILDFSERNYFDGLQIIRPISPSRANWKRIFSTALDDLAGLVSPEKIIYCEGRPDPSPVGEEQGLDAKIYNVVFEQEYPEALFISSGGKDAQRNAELALKVLSKTFDGVSLLLLKDRDRLTDVERQNFLLKSSTNRMLVRHEIENYLFDFSILSAWSTANGTPIDESSYNTLVPDPLQGDLKAGGTLPSLQRLCGFCGSLANFKLALAAFIRPDTAIYAELKNVIF